MTSLTRPVTRGYGTVHHPAVTFSDGFAGRPCHGSAPSLAAHPWSMSGPAYKGMDPSDPSTWIREWQPSGGMISYLNFDGARYQDYTPTGGVQRGRQSRRRG